MGSEHSKHWRYGVKGPSAGRGTYATVQAARRAVDRLDTRYGAYRHSVVSPAFVRGCAECDRLDLAATQAVVDQWFGLGVRS